MSKVSCKSCPASQMELRSGEDSIMTGNEGLI